ncbi:MAG: B12-binding domain-containing radical SAM protein [Candidatus Helarchaeota archaeon]
MSRAIDVLFLVPPLEPLTSSARLVNILYNQAQSKKNVITIHSGILSMAACLLEAGFSCEYVDLRFSNGLSYKNTNNEEIKIENLIKKFDPKIVALTSYTSSFNAALKVIEIIKKINPNILVCVGGPHVTFLDKYSLEESDYNIDVIVRGEGERTMLEITENYLRHYSIQSIEDHVQGVTTKKKRNPDQKLLSDEELDHLPPLAFNLIPMNERKKFIYIPITASRGCVYKCTFCANPILWRYKVRFRKPEKVIEEVLLAEENFPKRVIQFSDTILPLNFKYFEKLINLYSKSVESPVKMIFTRANFTDEKRLQLLKKILTDESCYVSIGIENTNSTILQKMGKPSFEIQLQALKNLKKFAITSVPTWMQGFCGETLETMTQNLKKLEYLNKEGLIRSTILSIWIPLPGSQPFQNPKAWGVKIHTYNWDFYDRAASPPPYSLFDVNSGEITLSNNQIWAYFLSMVALQSKWRQKHDVFEITSPSKLKKSQVVAQI